VDAILTFAGLDPAAWRQTLSEGLANGDVRLRGEAGQRLPGDFVLVLLELAAGAVERKSRIFLDGFSPDTNLALALLDTQALLGLPAGSRERLPVNRAFTPQLKPKGFLLLRAQRDVGQLSQLSDAAFHSWLRGLTLVQVEVDLSAVEHINSVLVAWLLQLGQAAAPAKLQLSHVTRQAKTQLTQLRLDHLMTILADG